MLLRRTALASIIVLTSALAACGDAATAPAAPQARPAQPTQLIAAGDGSWHILSETTIGTNFVSEYELGAALLGEEYQGSVFIRVSVPTVSTGASSGGACITSTLLKTEVRPGWTATVKKAGGCDKPIEVAFESTTKQRATFKWTYIFGLTKVDHGLVK